MICKIEYLIWVQKSCPNSFICINFFDTLTKWSRCYYYYFHFTDDTTGIERRIRDLHTASQCQSWDMHGVPCQGAGGGGRKQGDKRKDMIPDLMELGKERNSTYRTNLVPFLNVHNCTSCRSISRCFLWWLCSKSVVLKVRSLDQQQ